MERRAQDSNGHGKNAVGRFFLCLLFLMLISCERAQIPQFPPDSPPKPRAIAMKTASGMQNAVYSYTGRPVPLHMPEAPIPVRNVTIRT